MMSHYAIYDLNTGHIIQTHVEVNASGISKELSDHEVLRVLPSDVKRDTVGVVRLESKPASATHLHVDTKNRRVVATPIKTPSRKHP